MQIWFSKKVEVPAEILLYIFRLFSIRDVQSLRLVSKAFESVASLFLISSLWISPDSRDHEKLLAISQHSVFSQTIEEICYDASQSLEKDPIDGRPLSRAQYIRRFSGTWPEKTLGLKMSKDAASRGYQVYKRRLEEEKAAATHSNHDSPFSSDLATLLMALPRMHRVKRFVISDQRYSRMDPTATNTFLTAWNFSCRIEHHGVQGSEAIVLKPRCWVSNDEDYPPFQDRQAHRGFPVMMQAASIVNLTSLESFSVDRHSEASGLSYEVFDMSASELQHTLRAFRYLKTLSLKINSIAAPIVFGAPARADPQWADMIRRGTLAQLCSAAPGLESLEIQFDGDSPLEDEYVCSNKGLSLTDLFSDFTWPKLTWPKLTSLTLGWMIIPASDLLHFLHRHRTTLRRLCLNGLSVFPEEFAAARETIPHYDDAQGSLGDLFKSMAERGEPKLKFLDVSAPAPAGEESVHGLDFVSEDGEEIGRFLSSGGLVGNRFHVHGRGCLCGSVSGAGAEDSDEE